MTAVVSAEGLLARDGALRPDALLALLVVGAGEWATFWKRFETIAGDMPDTSGPGVAQLAFRAFADGSLERALWRRWAWGQA